MLITQPSTLIRKDHNLDCSSSAHDEGAANTLTHQNYDHVNEVIVDSSTTESNSNGLNLSLQAHTRITFDEVVVSDKIPLPPSTTRGRASSVKKSIPHSKSL
ncbi:hypothetical protein SLE2022_239030 [Rubroshorea leprosula]